MCTGRIAKTLSATIAAALFAADLATAGSAFILASGRRDPRIYAIDLDAALKPGNNNTPNAIVSRSLVSPRRLAATADGRYAVVTGGDDTLAASATTPTGMVYVVDLVSRRVAAQVTNVGIDPYGVAIVDDVY
jgi:hypothetical protein